MPAVRMIKACTDDFCIIDNERIVQRKIIRLIDKSGEDYLHAENSFVAIELPQVAEDAFMALA